MKLNHQTYLHSENFVLVSLSSQIQNTVCPVIDSS